jgi:hypothetical protein
MTAAGLAFGLRSVLRDGLVDQHALRVASGLCELPKALLGLWGHLMRDGYALGAWRQRRASCADHARSLADCDLATSRIVFDFSASRIL